ncbi:MAG: ATP-binding protein [Thermoguttaceae bacterium]|jgi:signal transduction histidine kinase
MKLPPEGARWLVSLRWLACAAVFGMTWFTSSILRVVANPLPLYLVACAMAGYNLIFKLYQRDPAAGEGNVERNIFWQIAFDLTALTLLLYFSDLPRNPFLFFFVFHMIIAGMYLRGSTPYFFAAFATCLVGIVMLLEYLDCISRFAVRYPSDTNGAPPLDGLYLLGVFAAFASALWIAVYFTTSIRRYVDRAHAEIRQKEKMLGIGQLVAGIAHQIANPLDGMQNCLRRIGDRVKNDPHLAEYVQLMAEALERIERTAKRVQAFARPRGITLQSTDANQAVEATLEMLGPGHGKNIHIRSELGDVAPVQGDPYTLQEVLFNLCTNALNAMPHGGTLTLRTYALGRKDEDQMGSVAIDVSDTGVGIPRLNLEKIFEPFFTTRADSGGTGLGLGLCRMLISEMGGRIEVRSALGQGATFTVILNPASTQSAKKSE